MIQQAAQKISLIQPNHTPQRPHDLTLRIAYRHRNRKNRHLQLRVLVHTTHQWLPLAEYPLNLLCIQRLFHRAEFVVLQIGQWLAIRPPQHHTAVEGSAQKGTLQQKRLTSLGARQVLRLDATGHRCQRGDALLQAMMDLAGQHRQR